jgi:two-component system response regulator
VTGPILYVEDDADDKQLTLFHFKRLGVAARIEWARDGIDALDYLAKALRGEAALPALILADIKMPKMDGFELLKRVRGNTLLDGIPFVFLTSSGDQRDRSESARMLADAYLQKPACTSGYADVAARVQAFLEKARA